MPERIEPTPERSTAANKALNRRFSVAPMLDWTTSDCRNFHRMLTRHALLYTEMVTTGALLFGQPERHLRYADGEHPLALQLGGSDPDDLARCAEMAQAWGYDEVNLNVGCPSDRVQSGRFGACLMADPGLVASSAAAMLNATDIPVTIKCRIGIDDQDEDADLQRFVEACADAGVTTFIVHARKAWLQGLSPKQNRDVPPLNYERVYRLKRSLPELEIILNGGIQTLADAEIHLQHVDGIMMGRSAYQNPLQLREVDQRFYGDTSAPVTLNAVIDQLCAYGASELERGRDIKFLTRHIVGLFQNCPGARQWRRYLSENAHRPGAGVEVIRDAAAHIDLESLSL